MSLLLAIKSGSGNWSAAAWAERFRACLPDMPVVDAGGEFYDTSAVRYAAVWKPAPGLLASLPNLRAIFNLGAGVDALLADLSLPKHVPIARVVDPDLTRRMTEYVVWHVLDQHRQGPLHRAAQLRRAWIGPDQRAAKDLRVGLMGLGAIARDAAEVLARLGFQVAGWSRSIKSLPGVRCHHGADGLDAFLATTDILVVLLPLTRDTRHMINVSLLRCLAKDGPLGKPVLINAGRGGLQVEADILACLDEGSLGHAVLDVFETEPLPASNPLWAHPGVTITPHNAADSDPDAISGAVADQIRACEQGHPLRHLIDRPRGY